MYLRDLRDFINKIAKPKIKIPIKQKPLAIIYFRVSGSKQRKIYKLSIVI